MEYEGNRPVRVDAVVLSTQHGSDIELETLRRDVMEQVIKPVIPAEFLDDKTNYYINPTGRFVVAGPKGLGPDRAEDIVTLRQDGSPRRRRLLRKGPHKGGPFCGLCRPVCGEERCGRRVSRPL